jgi:hypothetical protein
MANADREYKGKRPFGFSEFDPHPSLTELSSTLVAISFRVTRSRVLTPEGVTLNTEKTPEGVTLNKFNI